MSPKRSDPLQVQLSSSSNETVLHNLVLKKWQCTRFRNNNLEDDSVQDSEITVCKRLWYNLQGSYMVQFARDRLAVCRIIVCKIWV